jgi:hypothetical protein
MFANALHRSKNRHADGSHLHNDDRTTEAHTTALESISYKYTAYPEIHSTHDARERMKWYFLSPSVSVFKIYRIQAFASKKEAECLHSWSPNNTTKHHI